MRADRLKTAYLWDEGESLKSGEGLGKRQFEQNKTTAIKPVLGPAKFPQLFQKLPQKTVQDGGLL